MQKFILNRAVMSHSASGTLPHQQECNFTQNQDILSDTVVLNTTNGFNFDPSQQFHSDSDYTSSLSLVSIDSHEFGPTSFLQNDIDRCIHNDTRPQQILSTTSDHPGRLSPLSTGTFRPFYNFLTNPPHSYGSNHVENLVFRRNGSVCVRRLSDTMSTTRSLCVGIVCIYKPNHRTKCDQMSLWCYSLVFVVVCV